MSYSMPCSSCENCPLCTEQITYWGLDDVQAEPYPDCIDMTHKQILRALGHKCVYASREKRAIKRFNKNIERDYNKKARYER